MATMAILPQESIKGSKKPRRRQPFAIIVKDLAVLVKILSGRRLFSSDDSQPQQIESLRATDRLFAGRDIGIGKAFVRHSNPLAYGPQRLFVAGNGRKREDKLHLFDHCRWPLPLLF